jgi:hypothetical protein
MTTVLFSVAFGRPYNARKAREYTRTWAIWWKGDPRVWSRDGGEFPEPDAWGGARTGEDVASMVNELAARFGKLGDFETVQIEARYCQSWRWVQRGHSPSAAERAEQKRAWDAGWRRFGFDTGQTAPASTAISGCFVALGLDERASEADVRRAFRLRARDLHPDRGGDEAAFKTLNANYVHALKIVRARAQFSEARP